MKKITFFFFCLLLANISVYGQEITDPIFYQYPNSGVNFEGLYANPANGTACIGDFNEDGYPDLIIMGPNYDEFSTSFVNLLLNNGDGTFKRINLNLNGMNNGSITYLKIASKQYILALQGGTASPASNTNAKAYTAELKIGTGGQVICNKKQDLANGLINGDILFVDVDGDGIKDLLQYGGSRKVYTYINNGANNFTLTDEVTGLTGTYRGKSVLYDVNKDGKEDVVTICQSGGLQVSLNSGNKSFTTTKVNSDYGFKTYPRLALGDFDKDGSVDIVAFDFASANTEYSVVFFYGDGTGAFTQTPENSFMGVGAAAIGVGDFNSDGNLDVLYAGENYKVNKTDANGKMSKKAYILLGDGNRNFTQHVKATDPGFSPDVFCLAPVANGEYHIADFDKDGKPDIFALGDMSELKGGKLMRRSDMFLSSLTYDFGAPVEETAIEQIWKGVSYKNVRLKDSRLKQAMDKHMVYLKSLDENRLLGQTLKYNLGITDYPNYGGWEDGGNGATFAHYLSAVSMGYAATGDPDLLRRANRIVEVITESQRVMGDGFFAFNDAPTWGFNKMAKEKIITPYGWDENGHPWGNNGIGFPWYAHHKIFAALRDAYIYTGNEDARITFIKFCDWAEMWIQNFTDENLQKMLESEHGGMVESFADAYALSGKTKFLDAARRFTRNNFAQAMSEGRDDLSGRHSNFHVPMVLGAAVHYLHSGDQRSGKAAHNFFEIVHDHHTLCNGGHGNNERFGTPDLLTYRLGQRGPETCSSYNMLKLAKELFCQEGKGEYLDYYENTMLNHILAILSPRADAGVCYHVNLKPGTFKMYDDLYANFWCCVGTGMESHMKYVDAIYFEAKEGVLVNIFTPSTIELADKGFKMSMDTDFPATDNITLTIDQNVSFDKYIFIRYPKWADPGSISIKINGNTTNFQALPGELIRLGKSWASGDKIEIIIPCKLRLVDLPDDVNVSALFYGPVLLGANFGEVGQSDIGNSAPTQEIKNPVPDAYFPSLAGSRKSLSSWIEKEAGTLKFKTKGLSENYNFEPFYDLHHCRYNVYWKVGDTADLEKERELVPDRVLTGVTASENLHNVLSSNSNTGASSFDFWGPTYNRFRDASSTGYIQYTLDLLDSELPDDKQYYLQLTYFGDEPNGYGNFWIYVDDERLSYQGSIARMARLDFAQRYYAIPRNMTDGKTKINVKFTGGRISLYGIKITTSDNLVEAKKEWNDGTSIGENIVDGDDFSIWYNNKHLNILGCRDSSVSIFNMSGQSFYNQKIMNDEECLDLPLSSGLYIVKLTSKKGVVSKKIIVGQD